MMKTFATLSLFVAFVLAQPPYEEPIPISCRNLQERVNDNGETCSGAAQCGEDEGYELLQPRHPDDVVGETKNGTGNKPEVSPDPTLTRPTRVNGVEPTGQLLAAQTGRDDSAETDDTINLLAAPENGLFPNLMQNDKGELSGLCKNLNNLAPIAFPSGSGGGIGTYGPSNMNDLNQCQFYWPSGNAAIIQYRWQQAQSIAHFVIKTDPACEAGTICAYTNAGRGIGRGTVQYWSGSSWVTDGSFTNTGATITYRFRDCITTSAIRVVKMVTHNCGQQSNPVVYEWSVCECEDEHLRLCGNATNLAPFATPSGTSGGIDIWGYGPSEMNDLDKCQWFWPGGNNAFINYQWDTPVFVGRFVILTDPACVVNTMCVTYPNMGRGVADGTVSYYDSSNTWVVDGSFRSREGRIEYELRKCVEITQLRIDGISTHNCGQQSNPVIYEWSACCCEPDDCCCH